MPHHVMVLLLPLELDGYATEAIFSAFQDR
jgi:hypothetical protein